MDATVQVAMTAAIAAVVSALISGIISPRINWGIERRRSDLQYKKDHIHAWRKLVSDLTERYKVLPDTVPKAKEHPLEFLNSSDAFYSLKPKLTSIALRELNTASYEAIRKVLIDEIARIEKDWKLLQ